MKAEASPLAKRPRQLFSSSPTVAALSQARSPQEPKDVVMAALSLGLAQSSSSQQGQDAEIQHAGAGESGEVRVKADLVRLV